MKHQPHTTVLHQSIARALRASLLAGVFGLSLSASAIAQAAQSAQFDIPAQPLSAALKAYAQQSGMQLLYRPETLAGSVARPLRGHLDRRAALQLLLQGTDLEVVYSDGNAATIRPRRKEPLSMTGDVNDWVAQAGAQARPPQPQPAAEEEPQPAPEEEKKPGQVVEMEKMVVTGSRLKRAEIEGAVPVNVYTREEIDKSGQPDLAGFLNTLNEVSVGSQPGTLGPRFGGQSSVQLRGLPVGTTLVLINGRRVPPSGLSGGGDNFNLDLIPFAAIERIEVLPVGSSAVYGGDALAGVINIILKKSFDGWAVDARLGSAKGANDGSVSFVTGGRSERGSFLLMGAYSKQSPLSTLDRDFFKDADYRRFGGPDARSRRCSPGTVSTTDGSNLPGLTSSFAGIPSVPSGQALTIADFAATAGVANLCGRETSSGNGSILINRSETYVLHAAGDYRLGDAWQLFGELTYTDRRWGESEQAPAVFSFLTVSAANPFNPFGVPVRVEGRLGEENGLAGSSLSSAATRTVVGVRGEFGRSWELETSIMRLEDEGKITTRRGASIINFGAFANALASSTPELALNPFTTGRAATDEVLNGIWPESRASGAGKTDLFNAFVRGSIVDLPAGPVDAIAGVEAGRTEWRYISPGTAVPPPVNSRRFDSQFAELRVPLLSEASGSGSNREIAALTLAGRRDNYSDFGTANTYQAGLELRPVRDALLRAATATSFQPPTLFQSNPIPSTFSADGFGLTDPLNGNQPIPDGVPITFGLTPDLKPQTGKSHSLGGLWEPSALPGLRLGLTAWQVKLRDQVILPGSPQVFLDNEALFPGYVTRRPGVGGNPGPVTALGWTYVNFGRVDVSGTDIDGAYALPTSFGKWNLAFGASRTSKYEVLIAPGAAVENRLSNINTEAWAPKWKGRLSAGLERGPWNLGVTGRYLGGYKDFDGVRDLGDLWFFDLVGGFDLKQLSQGVGGAAIKSATLSAAVVNVGDKLPQFSNNGFPFYDTTQGDWRGRYFTLRFSATW